MFLAKRGKQFEQFVKWLLKNEPEWITQVDQVWLWHEYPDRWGKDCGINLIFKHKNVSYGQFKPSVTHLNMTLPSMM